MKLQTDKSKANESTYCNRTWAPTLLLQEKQAAASDVKTKTDKKQLTVTKFYVVLTMHLSPILVINKLDEQFFFCIYLFQFSTCFEHTCAHHQENQLY